MFPYMRYINGISRCSTRYRGEMLKDSGLKGCHCVYILNICNRPGLSQDELSKLIFINKSNVARQLNALEDGGFIYRSPRAGDKRVTEVFPTRKSIELIPRLKEILKEWHSFIFADFSEQEKELFGDLVRKAFKRALEKVDEVCPPEEE